ncbi:MAG: phosphoserine transaminase [Proteobacteria bacterium]|nr:phosphoserine transaminase [Pseudomonadota bacterium]
MKPVKKPENPNFSSGPCSKRPGYTLEALNDAPLGRSHRSALGKSKLAESIDRTRRVLGVPEDYKVGIVPASDTGAFEMAMWSLLGPREVDVLVWESFGKGWATDITQQLKLDNVRVLDAEYGKLPDLSQIDFNRDVVFTWNGTTSGVRVPDGNWIPDDRSGLALCDATSAVFAMDLPWKKLDVVTYSWQKVLGGEGAHGVLILSPAAVERLESYTPPWPMPKIFRLTKNQKLNEGIFKGSTINTPSMLCNEDYLDTLRWVESLGGLGSMIKRCDDNLGAIEAFVEKHEWIGFLAESGDIRSNTSVCLTLNLEPEQVKSLVKLLADENVAYDCGSYRDAPPGLRFWCGATIEASDVQAMLPWLEWAYHEVKKG